MRTLMIGGTGNISSGMVPLMIQNGQEVVLVNRGRQMIDGAATIVCDRKKYLGFEKAMQDLGNFDCVIDMIGFSIEDAASDIRAFAGKTRQFIFVSTVDTYRKQGNTYPIAEDCPREVDIKFTYAYQKLQMEHIFEDAAAKGAFQLTIVRPAATYNDQSEPIGILNSGFAVMRRILERKPVIVLGDGTNLWTFSHRDDVGRAIVSAIGNEKTYGKSYTVCGDKALSWETYYQTLASAMRSPAVEFVHVPTDILFAAEPLKCDWCEYNFKHINV